MTQEINKIFKYNEKEIRTIIINGNVWFVGNEICEVLEIQNTAQAISRLDDDEKLVYTLYISGQNREVLLINEPGLYSLVLTSRKPEAKDFKRWITHDVIPQIRQTGSYLNKDKSKKELARELAIAYNDLADSLERTEKAEELLAIQAPKVKIYDEFFDASLFLDGSQVARLLHPKLHLGRNKIYEKFIDEGILMRRAAGGITATQAFLTQHPNFIKMIPETTANRKTVLVVYFYPAFVAWYIEKHQLI